MVRFPVGACLNDEIPPRAGFREKRLMGFEPTTFCMASRGPHSVRLLSPGRERLDGRDRDFGMDEQQK